METTKWNENVILVDADFLDAVAFDLTVNFERMLMRRIPKADLAQWMVCAALDGGVKPGDNALQVVLVHSKEKQQLDNFNPSHFATQLDGQAFNDESLGEFQLCSIVVENLVSREELFCQVLETLADAKEIKRLIVVPEMTVYGNNVKRIIQRVENKNVTILSMEPQAGRGFTSDILGYSLMSALGIRGQELK